MQDLVELAPDSDEALAAILLYADEVQAGKLLDQYRNGDSWHLHALAEGNRAIGVIGVECRSDGSGEVHHIAVAPDMRRRGLGRMMIDVVASRYGLRRVEAETDKDAVEFYAESGFDVESLGEKYPGVERFRCVRAVV